jgi:hypothetical protein
VSDDRRQAVPVPPPESISQRRTEGPIKTRVYVAPETDPRLRNEFAKGMRGRPPGDNTE